MDIRGRGNRPCLVFLSSVRLSVQRSADPLLRVVPYPQSRSWTSLLLLGFGAYFLLGFTLPNFFFHYTTAYDILRSLGVEIGKRDFMGPA